ncbi:MAG: DUF305 domain-containing protein, partial [Anaerolineales bacterium]
LPELVRVGFAELGHRNVQTTFPMGLSVTPATIGRTPRPPRPFSHAARGRIKKGKKSMENQDHNSKGKYWKFLLMIVSSMVLMYALTYLNSFDILGHAWFSETRVFMALLMCSMMAIIMLLFMWKNYRKKMLNVLIIIVACLVFASALFLVRTQWTVSDIDYMEAMIPHHSIAILTSKRAQIEDPRVRDLADSIISAQEREIKEMEWLIDDIRTNGIVTTPEEANQRPLPDFSASE